MASKREQVIAAVLALVTTTFPTATVLRNASNPTSLGSEPIVIVSDGDPGEPEVTLSPTTYIYTHRILVEIAVGKPKTQTADTALDDLLVGLGVAIGSNRTLGGLCDWIDAEAPATDELDALGAGTARWASVAVVATYGTPNPLT